jgi:holo-[acyl-carrier protein] synthase
LRLHPVLTTGVDLTEIARIERMLARYGDRFLARVYTPAEVLYCRGRIAELAARFAAKEAVSKALGVGMRVLAHDGIHWQDVEVIGDERGKPVVRLSGRAAERARELDLTEWAISLSHAREHAIAFVVAQ